MERQNQQEEQSIQWRRDKVLELTSQGHSQRDISTKLQIGIGTVNRDLAYIKQQSRLKIRKYIDETLPEEYEKCLVGITSILKEAWNTAQYSENKREKIHALSLAKECYSMKLDLLTNATVVNDAVRFVSSNNNKKSVSNEEEDKSSSQESKEQESDYDEDKDDQLEEIQEEETGEIATETINQVF
jgi:DNA-binding CsgD family transcriptional regulator